MAIKLDGFVQGTAWNEKTRKFEVRKLGTAESGAILLGLGVSGKDKEGNRIYGKPIDIKINIKGQDEATRVMKLIGDNVLVEFEGFFTPNNWEKDGKEFKGNQFLVYDSSTFVAKPNGYSKPADDDDVIPF